MTGCLSGETLIRMPVCCWVLAYMVPVISAVDSLGMNLVSTVPVEPSVTLL